MRQLNKMRSAAPQIRAPRQAASPAPPPAAPAALLAPMSERLAALSPHPGDSKAVRRSGIIAAVRIRVQQPSVTLPVNLAQNDWENDWEIQDRRRFC